MKKSHLIGIAMIAIAIALLLSLSGDVSTYATFEEAANSGDRVKLSGQLSKDKEMYYNPEENPNYFSFYMKDADGKENKVILLAGKPQEFERSEQIVLTGQMRAKETEESGQVVLTGQAAEREFVATEMLMKCPSKYQDEEILIRSASSEI